MGWANCEDIFSFCFILSELYHTHCHSTGMWCICNNRIQFGLQQPQNTYGLTKIFERPMPVPHTRELVFTRHSHFFGYSTHSTLSFFWIQHTLDFMIGTYPSICHPSTKPFCVSLYEGISAVSLGRLCHRKFLIGRSDRIGN